jgi:hypothetical protein
MRNYAGETACATNAIRQAFSNREDSLEETVALPVRSVAVTVRELTGEDERIVLSADTRGAVELLERVTEGADVRQLSAADRDRLLAAVYRKTYGDSISNSAYCAGCGNLFDFRFEISRLTSQVDASAVPLAVRTNDGAFRTERGSEFRLPTAEQELASASTVDLMARCIVSRGGGESDEEIEAAMESVAPLIDLELDAACPECGQHQSIGFNIQRYLLEALVRNRRELFRDVHRLAFAYRWSMAEILNLRRSERKTLVELVEAEMERRQAAGVYS